MAVKDDQGRLKGWRPPGGGIEFGEPAEQAVVRECLEELGEVVECGRQVCVLESIFRHEGALGHEVVFVFEVEFSNVSAYATEHYSYTDKGVSVDVVWQKVSELVDGAKPLFPDGLRMHV